jgi:alkylated DNA repair dioxygenase AlkB
VSISSSNHKSIDSPADARRIAIDDGGLLLFDHAFRHNAGELFEALMREAAWEQHELRLFGRTVRAPRLSAWYAEPGCDYRYSGLELRARPFSDTLLGIRARIAALTGHAFNSVLLNLYRDGNDAMGWHSDDERELGPDPLIASVSLGATRRFLLRHRIRKDMRLALDLEDGGLLVMEPPLQRHWKHAVARTKRAVGPRINLTWRDIRS